MSTPAPAQAFSRKGWCPGAWRPMRSGDGLILRLRPPGGCLDIADLRRMTEGAARYGNGIIEITRRAALQIRGIADEGDAARLRADLQAHGLVDDDAQAESARQVVHDPLTAADLGLALERALVDAAREDPALAALPAKFGFLIDLGAPRRLAATPGDIRIERANDGGLCLRAAGANEALAITQADVIPHAIALARAFARHPAVIAGRFHRMKTLMESGEGADLYQNAGLGQPRRTSPADPGAPPRPGASDTGILAALPFGQIGAQALHGLADLIDGSDITARLTPWRALWLPGADPALTSKLAAIGFITDPDDPLTGIDACPGAPSCASGMIETHALARKIAATLPRAMRDRGLHISGCDKGCARSSPAALTVIGTAQGHDLVQDGTVRDKPVAQALGRAALIAQCHAAATRQ
ncbi:MAG: precorrin-3B synthase [Salinarimonas sp.]